MTAQDQDPDLAAMITAIAEGRPAGDLEDRIAALETTAAAGPIDGITIHLTHTPTGITVTAPTHAEALLKLRKAITARQHRHTETRPAQAPPPPETPTCCGQPMTWQDIYGIRRWQCDTNPACPPIYHNPATGITVTDTGDNIPRHWRRPPDRTALQPRARA